MFSDENLFKYALLSLYLSTPPTIISLLFLTAPYGKHRRSGWGPNIPSPLAWFLMESPTLWLTFLLFPFGQNYPNPKSFILISPFIFHYLNRTIIYPLKIRKNTNVFPLIIAFMAFVFNLLNGYLQARWVSHYADLEDDDWFWWRFFGGLVVFVFGMRVNVQSDDALLRLKSEGGGYKIPRGGWFEYVSCPNYFGEVLEWLGYSVITWSYAGLAFFVYTCANLVPRARIINGIWISSGKIIRRIGNVLFRFYTRINKCIIGF